MVIREIGVPIGVDRGLATKYIKSHRRFKDLHKNNRTFHKINPRWSNTSQKAYNNPTSNKRSATSAKLSNKIKTAFPHLNLLPNRNPNPNFDTTYPDIFLHLSSNNSTLSIFTSCPL